MNNENVQNGITQKDQNKLINQIIEQIKEKHFGNWINPVKKEIMEQVSKVRVELQNLRNEWNLEKGMNSAQMRDLRC